MELSSLLLKIISNLDGERSIYAGFHLLRGKRSGQTLQDVEYYNLKQFFGILPRLTAEQYEAAVVILENSGFLISADDLIIRLTTDGIEAARRLPEFKFNGWDYRGNEQTFFGRLSLLVQTLSYFRQGETSFLPVQKDHEIQEFVKKVLLNQSIGKAAFSTHIRWEIEQAFNRSGISEIQKTIITHRLTGYHLTGWTWQQVAGNLKLDSFSVRLLFIEGLHRLLQTIENCSDLPFLRKMAEDVKVSSHLTNSSMKTKELFERLLSIEEIAVVRDLKMSTIEDHFVEMSINDPEFPLHKFVSDEDAERVLEKVDQLSTKRLRVLKDEFKTLSYFQLRLILGAKSGGKV